MTFTNTQLPVLIAGAGPVGLSLALMLQRFRIPYRIIDPSPQPAKESRALAIHARTLELFESLGIADDFTAQGLKVDAMHLHSGREQLAQISFRGLASEYPYILSLPQNVTEEILNRHVQVERGLHLSAISQEDERVTCEIADSAGAAVKEGFSYVVGCDGARSTTRHLLGSSFEGGDYEESFVLADVKVAWDLPEDEFHVFSAAKGILAVFAFRGGRSRVIVSAEAGALPREPTLEGVQSLAEERGPGRIQLTDPAWITGFRIHHRMVNAFGQGRVFLAGDAAHIHSPAGGQGMNTGIQDAWNLAWKLGVVMRGVAGSELLDSYDAERRPVAHKVLKETHLLTRMVTLQNPAAEYVRNKLAPVLIHAAESAIAENMSQLAVSYRSSPLSEDHHLAGSPLRAGDRSPVVFPFETFTLLVTGGAAMPESMDRYAGFVTVRKEQSLPAFASTEPALYLVRPDQYIAFRGPAAHAGPALGRYLERLLPHARL